MSRAHHYHLIAGRETRPFEFDKWEPPKTPYWGEAEFIVALCGEEHRVGAWNNDRFLEDEKHVTCPQCRAKIARAKLKARPADAPKLTLVRDPDARGGFRYKQGWRAVVDGEAVAILGFEEHAWHIYPYVARRPDDEHPEVRVVNSHGVLTDTGTTANRGMYRLPNSALSFKTKEDALLASGELRAAGKLKTVPELLAEYHANQVEWARLNAERKRKDAERGQKNTDTLEALREILAHDTLSNFQREGLMNAIAIYEAKVRPPAAADEAA
jgi:hypothetical protein